MLIHSCCMDIRKDLQRVFKSVFLKYDVKLVKNRKLDIKRANILAARAWCLVSTKAFAATVGFSSSFSSNLQTQIAQML